VQVAAFLTAGIREKKGEAIEDFARRIEPSLAR